MLDYALTTAPQTAYINAGGTILAAMIGALGAIAVVAIPYLIERRRVRRERDEYREVLRSVHHQVANSHETNLRDDLDGQTERMDRISEDIGRVLKGVAETNRSVAETNRRVGQLDKRLTDHIDGR